MSTKSFLILVIAMAVLLAAVVYMHRPRARTSTGVSSVHGDR
jgi:hypothetical protein